MDRACQPALEKRLIRTTRVILRDTTFYQALLVLRHALALSDTLVADIFDHHAVSLKLVRFAENLSDYTYSVLVDW